MARWIPVDKRGKKRPPVLLSVRYHIETGNLIFSRHIKVHSLPADRDHYSLSVTTRHADYVAKSLLLILFRRLRLKLAGRRDGCCPFLVGSRWIYAFCRGNDGVMSTRRCDWNLRQPRKIWLLEGASWKRERLLNDNIYSWYTRMSFIYIFKKFSKKNRIDIHIISGPNYRDFNNWKCQENWVIRIVDGLSFQLNSNRVSPAATCSSKRDDEKRERETKTFWRRGGGSPSQRNERKRRRKKLN